ncbi:hypothetical protein HNQ07_004312 [Deinococcus metalli]|uniref:Uncharacterized protein n=1 Tax=Deinococcus metalli TaxID=1141878 RepID=A0A7W8KII5_9DEIO|nr:hypothetical protein [Deinococcus metalli]MBB5378805.1 hypothetical protein [Deinococcus metalli]GHF60634.1 hypothetical protein GCM10017781_41060 [Deinococcus metalli]
MARTKPIPRPRYQQTYPDHLATAEQLGALGLKPGTSEPDAILEYSRANSSGLCALYERRKAVPVEVESA